MSKRFLGYLAAGIAAVALLVAGVFYIQRGAHLELEGTVLKVRTVPVEDGSSIAIIDFRFVNTADYRFIVRRVDVLLEDKQGQVMEGSTISDSDAARVFQAFPSLGQKFNESLLIRTRIEPHQSMDRMISARFEFSEQQLLGRKGLRVRVEDVDGAVSEIVEGAR